MPRSYTRTPIADRLFSKVLKTDGCWLWMASVNNKGYGQILVEKTPRHTVGLVHRLSWELANGHIPAGMNVLHHCDTPRCVKPSHLFLGSQLANARDCKAKMRHSYGERNGHARLSADIVMQIRSSARTTQQLADEFNVTRGCINHILRRSTWTHI